MKNKISAILLRGAFALAMLSISPCGAAFAADAAQPRVQVGVVAQRYPWNGMVDVKVKVSDVTAEAGATLTVTATPKGGASVVVATVAGVKDGERDVTFDANQFPALKGKKLNDVRITAKVE